MGSLTATQDDGLEGWVILTIAVVVVILIGVAVTLVTCCAVMVYDKKEREKKANEQGQSTPTAEEV